MWTYVYSLFDNDGNVIPEAPNLTARWNIRERKSSKPVTDEDILLARKNLKPVVSHSNQRVKLHAFQLKLGRIRLKSNKNETVAPPIREPEKCNNPLLAELVVEVKKREKLRKNKHDNYIYIFLFVICFGFFGWCFEHKWFRRGQGNFACVRADLFGFS